MRALLRNRFSIVIFVVAVLVECFVSAVINHAYANINRAFSGGASMLGSLTGGNGGLVRVSNSETQSYEGKKSDSYLPRIDPDSPLSGIRHAPLFAQIGLFVILGLIAIGLAPVGFDRLFPLKSELQRPRLWSGLLFSFASLCALGLLFALIFLG